MELCKIYINQIKSYVRRQRPTDIDQNEPLRHPKIKSARGKPSHVSQSNSFLKEYCCRPSIFISNANFAFTILYES